MGDKAAYGRRVITPRSAWRTSVVLLGCSVLLSGCTGTAESTAPLQPTDSASPASASPEVEPSPTPTSSPSPSVAPQPTSPLTGETNLSPKPVLVVKLDNTRNAQPHSGLMDADVVYIEEVEYGITRLAAVFSSKIPARIGPVRSARITDIDLLEQYGSPAFAFSGVQTKMWPVIDASSLIDISPNKMAQAYFRDPARRAPYNYFIDGVLALEQTPKASLEKEIGFVFSDIAPPSETLGQKAIMEWSYASARFVYDPISGLYKVFLNGERAQADESDLGQRAATVIIQNVKQTPSEYNDKGGGNTPHAETIGTGSATVLRDGLAYAVTWSRPDVESGTTFIQADGSPMPFKPGQQWVVLLDTQRPPEIRPKPLTALEKLAARTSSPSPSAVPADSLNP